MIYTVTLNPAIDNIIKVSNKLVSGKNNRIIAKDTDVGGKGTHVSIALCLLKEPNICTGIAGQYGYEKLAKLLKKYFVTDQFQINPDKAIRQNYVITDTRGDSSYLISEYGSALTRKDVDNLFKNPLSKINEKDYVIVSGNPSLKTDIKDFSYFLKKLANTKAKIIADVSGKYLREMLKMKLFLIKPNEFEFAEIISETIQSTEGYYQAYLNHGDQLKNAKNLAISLGKKGSILICSKVAYFFETAKVHTVNDTGSGDAYLAGLIYGFANKLPVPQIGILANAIGAAKAEKECSSGFDNARVKKLAKQIIYRKIG